MIAPDQAHVGVVALVAGSRRGYESQRILKIASCRGASRHHVGAFDHLVSLP